MRSSHLGAHRCTTWTGCSACPSPVVGASLLAPSSTPPDWRFNPRKGGSPQPLRALGSARRSASFEGCVTSTHNRRSTDMNINKYLCTGRLTKDPELKALPSGTSVCELRLAVDGMGRGREVGCINVSVFGSGGEDAAPSLSKGWLVAVDGRLEYGEWDSEGTKRHDYNVVGNVEFLTAPRPAEGPTPAKRWEERSA